MNLKFQINSIDNQINNLVFKFYNLNEEEIKIFEDIN